MVPSLAYAVPMCLVFIPDICNFLFWEGRDFVLKRGLSYTVAQTQNSILFASSSTEISAISSGSTVLNLSTPAFRS